MEEGNNKKKGDNPKGQGPSKSKKEKTKEQKEEQRAKQAEKKRLKKEQARLEAEAKLKGQESQNLNAEESKEGTKKKEKKKKEEISQNTKKNEEKEEKKIKEKKKNEDVAQNKKEEKKEDKKRKIKFFGLTTYEERNEELKLFCQQKTNKEENSALSTYEIIKSLSKNVEYSKVSEELIKSLRNIFLCGATKQTRNCKNLLNAFYKIVETFVNDDDKKDYQICKELRFLIKKIKNLLSGISQSCSGIFNTCKFLQLLSDDILSELSEKLHNYKLVSMTLKEIIKSKIEYFIERRVKKLVFENINNDLIQNGDTILIFGKSKIFRQILKKAKEDKVKFNIIFVDSPERNQMSSEVRFFANLGVPVNYTYLKGVSNLMTQVTKIFIKGDALLVNGDLIGKKGVSTLALIAKSFNRPVFVFCPFFKFMNKIILSNEPKIVKQVGDNYKEMTFEYDITPSEFINTIICENGYIHSSSIPVYIREIEEQDSNFINEKNYELERQ